MTQLKEESKSESTGRAVAASQSPAKPALSPAHLRKQRAAAGKKPYVPGPRSLFGRFLVGSVAFLSRQLLDWRVHFLDRLPQRRPFILIANHVTFIDAVWLFKSIPHRDYERMCAMIGADLATDYGLLGKLMVIAARAIPVDRKGSGAARSVIIAKNAIEAGNNVLIHPEGTRTRDGHIGPFLTGAAYLATKYHVPIVPCYMKGGRKIWPRGQKLPQFWDRQEHHRLSLDIYFDKPFYGENYASAQEMNRAMEETFRSYEALYGI